jgi:predicted MFS family arabinose efflux permease
VSIGDLVHRRAFRTLLVGQGVSALGDWMGTIAFMALVLELTGSPAAVGGILTLRLLPAVVGGPLAARAVARWDRRRTMLAMDAARAGLIAAVPIVRAVWWIYVLAFAVEVASIVFLPARDASIPELVDDQDLPVANGLVLGSSYATIPLGAAAFAIAAALPHSTVLGRPYALVFWIDAATFLVSFACIRGLHVLGRRDVGHATDAPVRFSRAFRIPLVRTVLPASLSVALGLGALFSLGIVFVQDVLGASDTQFGVLIALFGVGAAGGLALLQARRGLDPVAETQLGVAAIGLVIAAFSLAGSLVVAFLGAALFGAAAAFTLASGMGALQSRLAGDERVAAFAVFHVVIRVGLALSAVAAGAVGGVIGPVRWPVVGTLAPSRIVLLGAGVLILATAPFVRLHGAVTPEPPA